MHQRGRPSSDELQGARALARLLDASMRVPGTRWRFGLDALLGLVPGVGDVSGALISGYFLLQGARVGVSRWTLLRMAGNVAVETVVGAVPVLGDLFDAAWKANLRNMRLLEEHMAAPTRTERASRGWVLGVLAGLAVLLLAAGALAVWVAAWVVRAVAGAL